ncbi:DUF6314 family protein [Streptomyces griseoviridis]|uniref:DUF6314 domain-containing protein n=1 Tax=Streptomyces griseoviridis TaxID=45398 RepID=A0A3Q9KZV0_STRGD|nr:DUF6314 family protein [Streptomyces griseoviridis]AZS88316.1 hypothetical protein ELQ87_31805 [Streptomyces griseoviridis]QCN84842.1 hypothetical protein DDJ31_07460 [Streptomyces griseoviridis]
MGEFWPVADVLGFLRGSWRVRREVRDLTNGTDGRFEGVTVFGDLPDGGARDGGPRDSGPQGAGSPGHGLLHEERGTFTWLGVARPAERTLRFLPGADPGTADVRFADGRPFHDLDLRTGRHTAGHPCAADLYRGEFTVPDADHWRTVWRVGGPAKDLLLTTDYTRES